MLLNERKQLELARAVLSAAALYIHEHTSRSNEGCSYDDHAVGWLRELADDASFLGECCAVIKHGKRGNNEHINA